MYIARYVYYFHFFMTSRMLNTRNKPYNKIKWCFKNNFKTKNLSFVYLNKYKI